MISIGHADVSSKENSSQLTTLALKVNFANNKSYILRKKLSKISVYEKTCLLELTQYEYLINGKQLGSLIQGCLLNLQYLEHQL